MKETRVDVLEAVPKRKTQSGPGKRQAKGPPPPPPLTAWPPQLGFAETIAGKLGDTAGDVGLIARRSLFPVTAELDESVSVSQGAGGSVQFESRRARPVILVLGSGWGAHAFMKAR